MNNIVEIIKRGGLVIIPTDTVYGIIGDATNEDTIRRVFEIKKRDFNKPLLMLVNSVDMLENYVSNVSDLEYKIIDEYWPGPLTIVFKKNDNVSDLLTARKDTIGVRYPNNKMLLDIISKVGRPLLSTSVNISGNPNITDVKNIEDEIANSVDFIMDGGVCNNLPSTIVECKGNDVVVLRNGAIDIKKS